MNEPGGPVSCGKESSQAQEADLGQGVMVVAHYLWLHTCWECINNVLLPRLTGVCRTQVVQGTYPRDSIFLEQWGKSQPKGDRGGANRVAQLFGVQTFRKINPVLSLFLL